MLKSPEIGVNTNFRKQEKFDHHPYNKAIAEHAERQKQTQQEHLHEGAGFRPLNICFHSIFIEK